MEIAKCEGRCAYYNKCVYNGRIRSSADYFVGSLQQRPEERDQGIHDTIFVDAYTKANQKIEIKISKASA